jgi:hypothetical protein
VSFGPGENRELYRPLNQSGDYTPGERGCHKGHMQYLNVPNPQPNRRYYWARTDPRSIPKIKSRGWRFVTKEEPEWSGNIDYDDVVGAGLDTTVTRNDIALCWMSEEQYRRMREQVDQLWDGTGGDGSSEVMERGRPLQEAYGCGEPIYFRGAGHGFRHIEHEQ